MTLLQVMAECDAADVRLRTDDASLIGTELATRAIVFDRWPIAPDLDAHRPPEHILAERFARGEIDEDEFYEKMAGPCTQAPYPGSTAGPS